MIFLLAVLHMQNWTPKQIDLNEGWTYARVRTAPSIWNGPDAVPTSQWKVVRASSEEKEGENAPAAKAFDGDPKTFWHTQWKASQAPFPHEIVIDLGSKTECAGFRLLPRQTGPQNGHPNHIQVFLSNQPDAWGSPVLSDSVPNSSDLFQRPFSPVSARYLRLLVTDGHRGTEPFLAIAELGLIRNLNAQQKKDWESQYHISTVEAGDARFDLKGAALEAVKKQELSSLKAIDWQKATLPHAAWIRPLNKPEIWQGVTYYRRKLDISAENLNRSLELTIGAAMQVSDLWLNGEHVATRRGGYLPLVANLTGKTKLHNEVLVRVDNSDNPLVPPGKPQQDLDFMYGNGITRGADLRIQNLVHLEQSPCWMPTVATKVFYSGNNLATMVSFATVRNDGSEARILKLVQEVDVNIPMVTSVSVPPKSQVQVKNDFEINDAIPWLPNDPHLYELKTRISDEQNRILDRSSFHFGVSSVRVSREKGFILNGQPLELIGTNRHQDYPWVGPALSRNANYRDAKMIKDSGHNIVRLSHYPQSEEFLDACDQLGVMVIPCIAGWQFINKDPRFEQRVEDDVRELVQRDARHPCVAWFETSLNETYPPNDLAEKWANAARSTPVGKYILLAGDARKGAPWDIAYNQWRDEDMSRPQDVMPDKPGYVREYGDYEFGGGQSTSRVRIGDGSTKLLQETWNHVWSLNHLKPQLPWTMGFGTWEMFDHNVPWEFSVSASGLADLFRRQKPSYWFYKSQTEAKPYAKLAADWQPGSATRSVVVFTNCDEAVLKLNGKEIARGKPERGQTTKYGDAAPFDGSNTANLAHPPIVFRGAKYQEGKLEVVASCGKEKAQDTIRTAHAPRAIVVWFDDLGVAPGRNDLVFVRAALVDENGTVCVQESRRIKFSVRGATLAGESEVACEQGIASALVRTPWYSADIQVEAKAEGLGRATTDFSTR